LLDTRANIVIDRIVDAVQCAGDESRTHAIRSLYRTRGNANSLSVERRNAD
jgi:hypothetical protein